MESKKIQKIIIALILALIIAIIGCTFLIISTVKKEKTDSKKQEDTKEEIKEEEKVEPTPTPSASLNTVGSSLLSTAVLMEVNNCTNAAGSCEQACDTSTPVKINTVTGMEEIITHLQTGTAISSLPNTGAPMEWCGGIQIKIYYSDNTYTNIWFATRNDMVVNEKAPVAGGNWQKISYYHFETEELYQYLVSKYTILKSS